MAQSQHAHPTGWVLEWAPTLVAGGAGRLVKVTTACAQSRNAALAAALLAGRVGVANAAVVLAELHRLVPRLAEEPVDTVTEGFLSIAARFGPAEIRALRQRILAQYGAEEEFQDHQDKLADQVALSHPRDSDDGMAEYRLRLDPEGRAVLESALGPLAAPQPATATGPDTRTSQRRRAEALIQLARRAAAAGGEAPTTTKAAVFITLAFADLAARTGAGTVLGATLAARGGAGLLLAPETIRKMACDAQVIPVVQGAEGAVLDLGRTTRLFTPTQLKALWLRDRGCTIPGCPIPPQWCDAHHGLHWADHGPTDITNGVLLCGRHHTMCHEHGWAPTITPTRVTWDLTPGAYQHMIDNTSPDRTCNDHTGTDDTGSGHVGPDHRSTPPERP